MARRPRSALGGRVVTEINVKKRETDTWRSLRQGWREKCA